MQLIDAFEPAAIPGYLAAAALVALGTWVYAAAPRRAVHWSIGSFLVLTGLATLATTLADITHDFRLATALLQARSVARFLAAGFLVYWLSIYPHPWRIAARRWWRPAVIGTGALLAVVAGLRPDMVYVYAQTEAGEPGVRAIVIGLLGLLDPLLGLLRIVAGLILAFELRGEDETALRRSVMLLSIAFTIDEVWSFTDEIAFIATSFPAFQAQAAALPLWAVAWLLGVPVLAIGLGLGTAWLLVAEGRQRMGRWPRARLAILGVPVPLGIVTGALLATGSSLIILTNGIFALLFPVLVAYAILRTRFLGMDARFRIGVKSSTIAASFVAVFFAVSEGAAAFFQDQTGSATFGIVAAAGLVFFLAPLQRLADRIADAAVPDQPGSSKKRSIPEWAYRDQLRLAWLDGKIEPTERRILLEARRHLRLSAQDAEKLEAEFLAKMHDSEE